MGSSKYITCHDPINRSILLIDSIRAEAMMEQVLSNRRAGRGQGRKRLRSDAEDSEEEWWRPRQNPLRLKTDNSEKSGKIEDPKLESE